MLNKFERRGAGSLKKIIWAFVLRFLLMNTALLSATAHIAPTHAPKV